MEYKTKEKKGLLHVQVTFKPQTRDGDALVQETKDVIEWVKANRPELKILKELSKGRGYANNSSGTALTNSWVFAVYDTKNDPKKSSAKKTKKISTRGPTKAGLPPRSPTPKRKSLKKTTREE
jgi:hypothetical protein